MEILGFTRRSRKRTRSGTPISSSPAASSGFPLGRLIAALALAAGSASCLGGQVLSLDPPELRRALRSGDPSFLAEAKDEELKGASRLGPGGAYCLSRHFSRLGLDGKAEILLGIEWKSASTGKIAREKSGRALMDILKRRGDWKEALALSRAFLKRFPDDPEALFLKLESLVRLGEHREALGQAKAASAIGAGRAPSVRACLAAAALLSQAKGAREEIDAFLREERDGKAIILLSELLSAGGDGEASSDGEASLLRARAHVAQREYGLAAADFKLLPGLFAAPPGAAAVSDSGKAFLFGGMPAEGAELFLSLSAMDFRADATGKALARLYAGRCLLAAGRTAEGRKALKACLAEAPPGPEADAAAWFLIDSAGDRAAAIDAVAAAAPAWRDPGYFDDVLGTLIRECLTRGEYRSLLELEKALAGRATASVGQRLAYILARARSLGFLPEGQLPPTAAFGSAEYAAPSYYAIMAAALLGREEPKPAFADPAPPGAKGAPSGGSAKEAEAFILGLLDYGLEEDASAAVAEFLPVLDEAFLRDCVRSLSESSHHAEAARVAMAIMGKPGFAARRADLEALYPRPWRDEVEAAAKESGISAALLFALTRTESFFDPGAVSRAGAVGLAQLMPETAKDEAARLRIRDHDLLDPGTNLRLGASYLARLVRYFDGDLVKALLSYNGGMGRVRAWAKESPGLPSDLLVEASPIAETREYARKVLAALAVYGYLYDGLPMGDAVRGACPGLGGT